MTTNKLPKFKIPKTAFCPSCEKNKTVEHSDPETSDVELRDGDLLATEATIILSCVKCGTEAGVIRIPIEHQLYASNTSLEVEEG